MITRTYDDAALDRDYRSDAADYVETTRYRDPAGTAFVWLGWALAFAFWALTMSSFIGILSAVGSGDPAAAKGGMDAGGAGWFVLEVVGVMVLGGALGWGALRYATRDKRLDPMTEASTAALYDSVERNGGDDRVSRSPEVRASDERDSYRPA